MKVEISRTAAKQLRKIPAKDAAAILRKLTVYAETGRGDVKALTGSDYLRLRHGDWRAIFEIAGDVIVIRIAKRGEAYR